MPASRSALACALLCAAQSALALPPALYGSTPHANEIVERVFDRIGKSDCAGAVRALNEGLEKGYGKVALLAGGMYEDGICVKRSWDRAVHFFLIAHDRGERAAPYRLQAGYAAAENGPDMAAAIWWMHRSWKVPGGPCAVEEAARSDPDRFVAALRTWPQARLAACNYIAGVMATLIGDIEYPAVAQDFGLTGKFEVTLVPAEGRFEVRQQESGEVFFIGWTSAEKLRDRDARFARSSLEKGIREIAERALKRYPQPPGIDPQWRQSVNFTFMLE